MKGNLFLIILIAVIAGLYLMVKATVKIYDRVIQNMAQAIQQMEGNYPGSRAYENNNPGNLVFANQIGSIGQDSDGFAIFPDYVTGKAALIRQLNAAFYGGSVYYDIEMSLYEFFAKWDRTNPVHYAEFVASELGVSPNTKLKDLS